MQEIRRARKPKIIKIHKNTQELAQDNLLEISILHDDRFVDESQILQLKYNEAKHQPQKHNQEHRSKQSIIHQNNYQIKSKVYINAVRSSIQSRTGSKQMKDSQLVIHNKIYSNSVFVGTKNNTGSVRDKTNCMLIQPKKRLQTCPNYHSQDSSSTSKILTEGGQKGLRLRKSAPTGWRIRNRNKQQINQFKKQLRTNLFFNNSTIY